MSRARSARVPRLIRVGSGRYTRCRFMELQAYLGFDARKSADEAFFGRIRSCANPINQAPFRELRPGSEPGPQRLGSPSPGVAATTH